LCAGRGPTGDLVSEAYNGGTWSAASWKKVGATASTVYSPLGCAPDDLGNAICAWLTTGSAVAAREFNGSRWSAEVNTGGTASNPPVCTDAGVTGQLACFATGTDSALFGNPFAGGKFVAAGWGGWGSIGGLVHGYGCAEFGRRAGLVNYACGVTGLPTSGFYTNEYNGSSWGNFVQQGTHTYIGSPSCFALNKTVTPGRVMCVVTEESGRSVSIVGP